MIRKLISLWAKYEKWVTLVLVALAVLFPVISGFNRYVVNIGVMAGIYAILTLSLNMMTGYTGVVTLGHAAFYGLGAYAAGILNWRLGLNVPLTFIAAMVVSGLFGLLLGLTTLQLSGRYLTIVTLSFCEIIRILLINLEWLTRGPLGITNIKKANLFGFVFNTATKNYYLVLAMVLLSVFIVHRVMNSRTGRAIIALKNDETAASSMSVNVFAYKLRAFCISSAIAGLAGALYAHYIGYIDPNSFGFTQSIQILSMGILGGLGNIFGSIFGAVSLSVLPELLRSIGLEDFRQVIYGVLLALLVLIRPMGIFGKINLRHRRLQDSLQLAGEGEEAEA
ncbi:MAG: branched-chain amino acid ABC transporter permease [Lachnospiraceae bacterium]|nr:branched-chain amino acid ABC transporter permease [Lachnospiraceae bacterium]